MSFRFDLAGKRVFVAGHRGMVGSALVRRLATEGCDILTAPRDRLDLLDQPATVAWVKNARPDAIVVAAARVGGILANASHPVDFLYDNLVIETNLIGAAHRADVDRLLFLGSSCIYPKLAPQPIPEEALLTGPLEPTNEWYAVAKIAGVKLCEAYRRQYGRHYISAMPTNLYGPNDNFDLESSHVLPALLRKIHTAKATGQGEIVLWGTGKPLREFLHVDDLADACIHLLKHYDDALFLNVGSGTDLSIAELATVISRVVGFDGGFVYDPTRPDGTPRKLLNSARLFALGWRPGIPLDEGIRSTYEWYLRNVAEKVEN
jgi:GDP-L-fucose synthase